jgi:hypothetical protein
MTIKELCKKHTTCDTCPYLSVCGDIPEKYVPCDDLETTNAIIETAKALQSIDYKAQYENHLKKSEVVISQLRADRDRLLKAFDNMRAEIMKLDDINPDYPMDRTIHISRNEVLQIIDKYKTESEKA